MRSLAVNLLSSAAGFVPGLGAFTALLNPTVLAAIAVVSIGAFLYGQHKGTSHMRSVCLAATKSAEAKASAVDREALQEQVSMLEKAIEVRDKERNAADLRIREYETRLKTAGPDSNCILSADDIGGL